jgi:uncharacterized protein YbjT (DUF2867 family)
MVKHTFAVMGATGHIGKILAEELLKRGHKVRALGRQREKLQELKNKGAEILAGDFTDSEFLAKGFKGCQAVFTLIPPAMDADDFEVFQHDAAEAVIQALVKAKVSHVLNLSALGANLSSGTGPIKELHRQEERLNLIPHLNVLHFRPSYFMENILFSLPGIKQSGKIAMALKADAAIPMVATKDIALKMAQFLSDLRFTGSSVFEFVGPKAVTMEQVTKLIGKAIGKPNLKYAHLSYDEAEKELIESGMKHQVAKLMVEMYRAANEGKIQPTQKLTDEHKGKTTVEEFVKILPPLGHAPRKAA